MIRAFAVSNSLHFLVTQAPCAFRGQPDALSPVSQLPAALGAGGHPRQCAGCCPCSCTSGHQAPLLVGALFHRARTLPMPPVLSCPPGPQYSRAPWLPTGHPCSSLLQATLGWGPLCQACRHLSQGALPFRSKRALNTCWHFPKCCTVVPHSVLSGALVGRHEGASHFGGSAG